MRLTLICEVCFHRGHTVYVLAKFDEHALKWPLDCTIFQSPNPHVFPDPFPAGVDWDVARCRQCGSRPFLNAIPQANGTVMTIEGERVRPGKEGRVLTHERGYVPIHGYPGVASSEDYRNDRQAIERKKNIGKKIKDKHGNHGVVVESIGPDTPPTGAFDDETGPVKCPACGKEYRSEKNLKKYHKCKPGEDKGA